MQVRSTVIGTLLVALLTATVTAGPATAVSVVTSSNAITAVPIVTQEVTGGNTVYIRQGAALTVDVPLDLPTGTILEPVEYSGPGAPVTSSVLVRTSWGLINGAYDSASALDANFRPVESWFTITGSTMTQTVVPTSTTVYPISIDIIYTSMVAPKDGVVLDPPAADGATYYGVPSGYVFNPRLGWRNDYCSASPDEFPAPGARNANFRGPCARHDQCYGTSATMYTCDQRLRSQLRSNCDYYYGSWSGLRYACRETADTYFEIVVIFNRSKFR